ncbi:MAG TPA: hypothetical protein VD769_13155, partial [Gaiellaceae bacterium]|nr:hypothetical protein [Gaiellaceae bacterium]
YRSALTGIEPAIEGVSLEVLDADDRLLLVNESGTTVVVLGYDGEPYLRVTPEGVFRNVRSPATWLNEDRYADVDLPPIVDAAAPPEWEQISEEPRVEWHDHRIHWMSPTAPPQVRDDPESAHRILDWNVPLEAGGGAVVVSGTLDYSPPDEAGFSLFLLVPPVALVLAGGVLWLARGRGRGGDEAASGAPLGAHADPRDDGVR